MPRKPQQPNYQQPAIASDTARVFAMHPWATRTCESPATNAAHHSLLLACLIRLCSYNARFRPRPSQFCSSMATHAITTAASFAHCAAGWRRVERFACWRRSRQDPLLPFFSGRREERRAASAVVLPQRKTPPLQPALRGQQRCSPAMGYLRPGLDVACERAVVVDR